VSACSKPAPQEAVRGSGVDATVKRPCKTSMPTPIMNFRLPPPERAALLEMAKLYGAANVSTFLREMVGAMCSGDAKRVRDFNVRLFSKVGEQLALKLSEPAAELDLQAVPSSRTARTKPKARTKR